MKTAIPVGYSKLWTKKCLNFYVWDQSCPFEAAAEREGVLDTFLSNNFFESINVLTWSHTTSHIPFSYSVDDEFNEDDCIIDANEPQVLDFFAVLLSTLESLEEQKFDQFNQRILVL